MALVNKHADFTPFDMAEKPVRQHPLLMPLLWGTSWVMTARFGLHIRKIRMKGLKPPFLVLATHQGFSDYFIAPRALFPYRANYVSDMEGFAGYGKWFYRHGGCIGKRRYTPDISVMNNIRYALFTLHQPVVLFPESRHCDAGVTSTLPENMGRLVKVLGVPLVILSAHGSYLANPFWDEGHTRRSRMAATLELLYTQEELQAIPADVLQKNIVQHLQYDEYAWQAEQHLLISSPDRAQGLHLPLYQCIRCGKEGQMASGGSRLFCKSCGTAWELLPDGDLKAEEGILQRIPDWYRWERQQTQAECEAGRYHLQVHVRIEALPNEKGFIPLGKGTLVHDAGGFTLMPDNVPEGIRDRFPLHLPSRQLTSVQTEYDYRGRGKCLVLSTPFCCYYVYSDDPAFLVTKAEFAAEYFYADISPNV